MRVGDRGRALARATADRKLANLLRIVFSLGGHSGRRPRFCGGTDSELLQKGSDRGQRRLVTIVGGVA